MFAKAPRLTIVIGFGAVRQYRDKLCEDCMGPEGVMLNEQQTLTAQRVCFLNTEAFTVLTLTNNEDA